MSDFVNYQKRGIGLPPGCKDLIDVLRLPGSTDGSTPAVSTWGVTLAGEIIGTLSDVPRCVSMLVNSRSEQSFLTISATDERLPIVFYRSKSEGVSALFLIGRDAKREEGIREFFRRRSVETIEDDLLPGDAPAAARRGLRYRLPADAPQASQIITDLLRGVYGCTEASPIQFLCYRVA